MITDQALTLGLLPSPPPRLQSFGCGKAQAAQKAPAEQLERTANEAVRTGEGLLADLAAAKRSLDDQGVRWGELAGYGLLAAVTFGFAFQVWCCRLHALVENAGSQRRTACLRSHTWSVLPPMLTDPAA